MPEGWKERDQHSAGVGEGVGYVQAGKVWVGVRFLIRVMWPRREEVIIVEEGEEGEEGEERTSVKAVVQMGREKRRERERER